jgi:hypothetical protein
MPRRRRTDKRRRHLTLQRDVVLTVGPWPAGPRPEPGDAEWEALRGCFEADPDRWPEGTWGHLAFGLGDVEAAVAANPLIPVD